MNHEQILESFVNFSESHLWKLQELAYKQFGPRAWTEKKVPFYLTSSSWTAHAYAQVVHAFFEDLNQMNIKGPVFLFDLGAGSGRLAYLFLKEWDAYQEKVGKERELYYVMTDIAVENIDFWKSHLLLQPYIKEKRIDFCFFSHDQKDPLQLLLSKKTLANLDGSPIILFANYFFDTIPQDLYKIEQKRLFQGKVALKVKEKVDELANPHLIEKISLDFQFEPLDEIPHLIGHELIKDYLDRFPSLTFLFPENAFRVLDFFKRLTRGPILLLAQDQALSTEEQFRAQINPVLALHSTFSLPVSYYSLLSYFKILAGQAWVPYISATEFCTLGGVLNMEAKETAYAFEKNIGTFDPWSFLQLMQISEKKMETLSDITNLIRFSQFDPTLLYFHFSLIREFIKKASQLEKNNFLKILPKVAERFFPLSFEEADFMVNLGVLSNELENFAMALEFFNKASKLGCKSPELIRNILLTMRKNRDRF